MAIIYHIAMLEDWKKAKSKGSYEAPSLQTEGFIHCSEKQQVNGVLDRYFKNKSGLLLLVLNTEKLRSPLKYELAPSIQEEFPHIYGPINMDAVVEIEEIA